MAVVHQSLMVCYVMKLDVRIHGGMIVIAVNGVDSRFLLKNADKNSAMRSVKIYGGNFYIGDFKTKTEALKELE